MWLGGQMVTEPDLRSAGPKFESRPPRCRVQPLAICLHTCASVTKQYNLVLANGRWCSSAGEVTMGLVESNDSLPPGLWLWSPAGWLPRTGISSRTLCSFWVWDYLYRRLSMNDWHFHNVHEITPFVEAFECQLPQYEGSRMPACKVSLLWCTSAVLAGCPRCDQWFVWVTELLESSQWCKQDQILKTKTKTKITRPRPPEVNKDTWQI